MAEEESETVSRLREGVLSRHRIRSKPTRAFESDATAVDVRAKVNQIASDLIRPIVQRGLLKTNDGWIWRHDEKLQSQSLYRMSFEHAQSISRQITCPQIVVLGEPRFPPLAENTG